MSSTFIDDLNALIIASTGSPADRELRTRVFEALGVSGFSDEVVLPTYFAAGIRHLALRQPTEWAEVPEDEVGLGWVLRDLVPLVPGLEFHERPGQYAVVAPALGLAFVVERGRTQDRWSVQREAAAASAPSSAPAGPRSFGTLTPSAEQLEQWAKDPELRLILEDEIIALFGAEQHFALLAKLAVDPATVEAKRRDLLAALDEMVTKSLWREGAKGLRRIDEALAVMLGELRALPGEVRAWIAGLQRLRAYALGEGAVSIDVPRELATQLLKGLRRPGANVVAASVAPWWQFAATTDGGPPREYLYVHPGTGALRFSAAPLTADQLDELGDVDHRLP